MDERNVVLNDSALRMNVLLIKPCMYPQQVQIGIELEDLRDAIGGNVEVIYPFDDPVGIILNEEGKNRGLELNRSLRMKNDEVYDIIAGDFLVVGLSEEDFVSLSPEMMKKYEEHFHQPEIFMQFGGSIVSFPVQDEQTRKSNLQSKTRKNKMPKEKIDRDSR